MQQKRHILQRYPCSFVQLGAERCRNIPIKWHTADTAARSPVPGAFTLDARAERMTHTTTASDTIPAGNGERSLADLKYLLGLHARCLEMNGPKVSPLLVRAAAEALAEYEAAVRRQR
jgi:hypothetical protein